MSFSTMQELKTALTTVANNKGHSSTNPVRIAYNNADTGYEPVRFVVSHAEPDDAEAPLNLLWYVTDPASPNYNFVLRRTSRSGSDGLQNTWSIVNDVANVMQEQVWDTPEPAYQDAMDHAITTGNAHGAKPSDFGAVDKSGDTLEGPLATRALQTGEEFTQAEVVPRFFVDSLVGPLQSITGAIVQSFNNFNAQMTNIRNRTQTLEDSVLGFKGFVYRETTAAAIWNIPHNMGRSDLLVQVYEGNELVWPASVNIVDDNNVSVEFAVPVAGRAELLPIVERA